MTARFTPDDPPEHGTTARYRFGCVDPGSRVVQGSCDLCRGANAASRRNRAKHVYSSSDLARRSRDLKAHRAMLESDDWVEVERARIFFELNDPPPLERGSSFSDQSRGAHQSTMQAPDHGWTPSDIARRDAGPVVHVVRRWAA